MKAEGYKVMIEAAKESIAKYEVQKAEAQARLAKTENDLKAAEENGADEFKITCLNDDLGFRKNTVENYNKMIAGRKTEIVTYSAELAAIEGENFTAPVVKSVAEAVASIQKIAPSNYKNYSLFSTGDGNLDEYLKKLIRNNDEGGFEFRDNETNADNKYCARVNSKGEATIKLYTWDENEDEYVVAAKFTLDYSEENTAENDETKTQTEIKNTEKIAKVKVLEKKLLMSKNASRWVYFFDGKEISEETARKKVKSYCKDKASGKFKYQLYVEEKLISFVTYNATREGAKVVKFFRGTIENELVAVDRKTAYGAFNTVYVPVKEIYAKVGVNPFAENEVAVEEYAVNPEAFDIAVQAEIENAEIVKFAVGTFYSPALNEEKLDCDVAPPLQLLNITGDVATFWDDTEEIFKGKVAVENGEQIVKLEIPIWGAAVVSAAVKYPLQDICAEVQADYRKERLERAEVDLYKYSYIEDDECDKETIKADILSEVECLINRLNANAITVTSLADIVNVLQSKIA